MPGDIEAKAMPSPGKEDYMTKERSKEYTMLTLSIDDAIQLDAGHVESMQPARYQRIFESLTEEERQCLADAVGEYIWDGEATKESLRSGLDALARRKTIVTEVRSMAERAQDFYGAVFGDELAHLIGVAEGIEKPGEHERQEGVTDDRSAVEALVYHAYGASKRVVHYIEFAAPVGRIEVVFDGSGDVQHAKFQYSDGSAPWVDAPEQDVELVTRYVRLIGRYKS
jgi:hypothetical protein